MVEIPNWDDYFMSMIYLAASRSKDENTHIGAVIVGPDNEIRSSGYNSFVRNLKDDKPERQVRPEKYFWFEHAERNAIYNAALAGISTKGCRMYTNGVPCMDCARGVVQAGIVEVIVDEEWDSNNKDIWLEHAKRTLEMFEEVGVKVRFHKFNFVELCKFRRGEKI